VEGGVEVAINRREIRDLGESSGHGLIKVSIDGLDVVTPAKPTGEDGKTVGP
jgi:hypothetical protein